MSIAGEATWIASGDGSVHAWVHRPTETTAVKGAVVIAPPLGREQVTSYRALRVLAMMLAEQGWVAVRFAFRGTGDSGHLSDPGVATQSWLEDLDAALTLAQQASGANSVHGIGLRLGATLLATSQNARWSTRLLWEPVGGREFVRMHSVLRRLAFPASHAPAKDVVELGGAKFTTAQAADLRKLAAVTEQTIPAGAVEIVEAKRQTADLLYASVSLHARVPMVALQELIDRLEPASTPNIAPSFTLQNQTLLSVEGESWPVVEELHSNEAGLLAIVSRPATAIEAAAWLPGSGITAVEPAKSSRAALFIAASTEPKDGVTALWVEAGRRLAARGVTSARAERVGCGDLGKRSAIRDPNPYTQEIVDGVTAASQWLAERTGLPVTGVGLCAGAWELAEAAHPGGLERVVLMNNVAWRRNLKYWAKSYGQSDLDDIDPEVRETQDQAVRGRPALKSRIRVLLRNHGPYLLWRTIGRFGINNVPEIVLKHASQSSEVLLHLGAEDEVVFQRDGGEIGVERLAAAGRKISVTVHDDLDHALLTESSRQQALSIIIESMLPGTEPSPSTREAASSATT